ncbi:MAG: 50S ribosomal protein L13 [Thermodesulfovibrionales bacterium]|nr:50S ribosomal protein L13 [Thermodesulfovibrionales bacterium]
MKTAFIKESEVERKWYLVDADGATLGRLASRIAHYLRGKHKPTFTPNADTGDFIIVINAEKVRLTGKKLTEKIYYWHSGYRGGLKAATPKEILEKNPERLIKDAVWGMLPKGRLGRQMFKKLKVYKGPEHPHSAQKPEKLDIR